MMRPDEIACSTCNPERYRCTRCKRECPGALGLQVHTDDLRTRIAKVLHARYGSSSVWDDLNWDDIHPATQERWRKDADAVLRELGVRAVCK